MGIYGTLDDGEGKVMARAISPNDLYEIDYWDRRQLTKVLEFALNNDPRFKVERGAEGDCENLRRLFSENSQ